MFGIAPSELMVVTLVAIVLIGPQDLPRALRFAGLWWRRWQGMNGKFRAVMDEIVRETERTGTAPAAAPAATDASAPPRIPAPHLASPAAIPSASGIVLPAV